MVSRANKTWNEEETEYLCEAWGNKPIPTIARSLGRSEQAIVLRAGRLGLGPFLDNGTVKGYINKHQLFVGLYGSNNYGGETYAFGEVWVKKWGLPAHKIKRRKQEFTVVYLDEFWEWAEKHQSTLDFSRFEKYALGPEPEWVETKRRRDKAHRRKYKTTPWTGADDTKLRYLLSQFKYNYSEMSEMLGRTEGAIQRRINDLGLKERPVKANNHNPWSSDDWQTLETMIKDCATYEEMSDVIGRSSKAIRGRVFNMYLTENLDKVRAYMQDGPWGYGKPPRPLRYRRLMTDDEKEIVDTHLSELAGMLLAIAKDKSGVCEEYRDYFQKDMCTHWDDALGCTAGETSCDSCTAFERIQPQFCTRCGATFYERRANKVCPRCRKARISQALRKNAYLAAHGKV